MGLGPAESPRARVLPVRASGGWIVREGATAVGRSGDGPTGGAVRRFGYIGPSGHRPVSAWRRHGPDGVMTNPKGWAAVRFGPT